MLWLWLIPAAAALVLLALWIVYRMAFYSDKGGWTDPYSISPEGEYQARREEMLDLISQLEHRPFVPVSVTSHDGLQLTGRYYHAADGAPLDIAFHGLSFLVDRERYTRAVTDFLTFARAEKEREP